MNVRIFDTVYKLILIIYIIYKSKLFMNKKLFFNKKNINIIINFNKNISTKIKILKV